MNAPLHVRNLRIYQLQIPLRFKFEHAAASRAVADPVIVELAAGAPYAHYVGYGETLARAYVTGETAESVVSDLRDLFAGLLVDFEPTSFADALEFIEALPTQVEGRIVTAARCALELALLDLVCRVHHRRPADVAGWLGLPGFGRPGCVREARYSGVVVGHSPGRVATLLWLQRLAGLRDFKLKVAVDGWEERLISAHRVLRRALAEGHATLRVDVNGGWSLPEAQGAVDFLERHGVSAIEQPLPDADDADLPQFAEQTACDLIADESLLTVEDAQRLISSGAVRVLNIRLAKNGGLLPALRIARTALAAGLDVQLGCLVGETGVLSAAGIAFLETCPQVRFVEGAYGRWLLSRDVTRPAVQFAYGGRIRSRRGDGFGVHVDRDALNGLCVSPVRALTL